MMNLQLHITNRCNQRCKHCYHDSYYGKELSLQEIKDVIADFVDIVKENNEECSIALTGGEPFMRKDFIDIIEYVASYKKKIKSLHILTNGSMITSDILKKIKEFNIGNLIFQISLEGDYEINDNIRGKGSFLKIFKAANLLKKNGFMVKFSATFSKRNYKRIFILERLLKKYFISLALRRFVPIGGAKNDIAEMLSSQELRLFYVKAEKINKRNRKNGNLDLFTFFNHCASGIVALDYPKNIFHSCEVRQKKIIVIMPNGDFFPCRVLPIKLGNIKYKKMKNIYKNEYSEFIKNKNNITDSVCVGCPAFEKCEGGAMCISYAVKKNIFAKDPQCWYSC